MRRFICVLLSLALLIGMVSFGTAEDAAGYTVGDRVNGFVVTDVTRFEMVGADIVLFEHEQTGALVMFILNDDLNRTFEITFRTPSLTDKGVAHVLEHSVLDGSAKYPPKTLFFNLSFQTYNTYMNAFTVNYMTSYPVASLSEEQLLLYADYYTDSVLNPRVIEDESIFREEAWRYALSSLDDELTIEGTVYSEMLGSYTINRAAGLNFYNTIFPGATTGRDHGGIPEVIYTMSWEDITEYHQTYYHPSNSLTCIYGKIEQIDAFLELLDYHFSVYEKAEFDLSEQTYQPITEPQYAVFEYGLAEDADTNAGSIVYYGFVCDNPSEDDQLKLDFLTTLISDDSSVFMQRVQDELPSANAGCYVDNIGPEFIVFFYATGINPEEAEIFTQIADESVLNIIENGFDPAAVDAIDAETRLDLLLANESSTIGTDLIPIFAEYWAFADDLYYYIDYIDDLDLFTYYALNGSMQEVAEKYLTDNPRTAIAITVPVAGLKEQNEAAFAQMLSEVKAGMSEEELLAIIAGDEEVEEDTSEYIAMLTAVDMDSLPEDVRIFDIDDYTDERGIRHIDVEANTDGIGQVALLLDAKGLEQDQLHYFKLFVDMMGSLNTESHSRQQLASLMNRYLYNGIIRVSVMDEDESYHPYMRCTFIALDEDLQAGYDLIYEMLFESDLSDAQLVLNNVSNLKNNLKRTITNNCYAIMLYRAEAPYDATTQYFNYMSYLDYYYFLESVEAQLESDPDTVLANLQAVQEYFFNRSGAIAGFVGNEESCKLNADIADNFLLKLNDTPAERKDYDFGEANQAEALIVDGSVLYNMYYASWEQLGLEGYNGAMDAVTAYVTDTYLYPLLRDQYGAYGVMHYATTDGVYIISYRDPNLIETFMVYESLPELIAQDEPDQETLNRYISSAYVAYATSNGELTDGFSALLSYVNGDSQELTEQYMHELKSLTPESFKEYASLYAALCENASVATSGSASVINQYADIYDAVLNPFGVKSADEMELADLSEDSPYYEAVMAIISEGVLYPLSESEFGVNEPATLGDLAVIMYQLIGGDYSPEDAVEFLAQYGVLPNEDVDTPLTREQMLLYTAYFCYVVGIEVEEAPVNYTDAAELVEEDDGFVGWILQFEPILTEGDMLYPQQTATRGELCYMMYTLFWEE